MCPKGKETTEWIVLRMGKGVDVSCDMNELGTFLGGGAARGIERLVTRAWAQYLLRSSLKIIGRVNYMFINIARLRITYNFLTRVSYNFLTSRRIRGHSLRVPVLWLVLPVDSLNSSSIFGICSATARDSYVAKD